MYKKLLSSLACVAVATVAHAQTYSGNGNTGFGGGIGTGSLSLSSDGTTLFGTFTLGTGGGGPNFGNELVIYVDTGAAGGFTSTSTFTDTGGGGDLLRSATSGLSEDGTTRSTLNFGAGFAANYAIALSPASAQFGAVYTLDNVANFTYDGSANLAPTGSGDSTQPTYTFSLPVSYLGLTSPSTFLFESTYLNGSNAYRSNEAIGNTIADETTPTNTGNIADDTAMLVGDNIAIVPEPSTWAMLAGGVGMILGFRRRRS